MNEDQVKVILKKSALQTTENFTDSLMERIEAKSVTHIQPSLPSLKRALLIITLVVVFVSSLFFCIDFNFHPVLEIVGVHRTKLFVAVCFLVLLGINHLLRLQHSSKYLFTH